MISEGLVSGVQYVAPYVWVSWLSHIKVISSVVTRGRFARGCLCDTTTTNNNNNSDNDNNNDNTPNINVDIGHDNATNNNDNNNT